ncbi:MAG: 1-deoxy-D-xylulose-5-phosphate reductoisomerase [Eubacteriales bacterium]|jgi:1-deoxy-D-xylulose-5-phosphate reductoisomerase|nr:1-deoxy-D-xylulose-5-phosphate reductoisomerase [Clostridiales bacterium]
MSIIILGSTGSVGKQAIEVACAHNLKVSALSCGSNVKLLEHQARMLGVRACSVRDPEAAKALRLSLADTSIKVYDGDDGLCEMIAELRASKVLNAVSGFSGLRPTLAAIDAGSDVALANKESLVVAGKLVMARAKDAGVKILPVDSEHSALMQCMTHPQAVSRLILTASGGPFFGKTRAETANVTPEQALGHPTWKMGPRVTIDSSTLMNKGFEVIEAARLYDISADKIDVVIHRESIIHSMVEYIDSALIAQLSQPDMRLCIQYALTYPERLHGLTRRLDLADIGTLTFYRLDYKEFPLLGLAYEAEKRSDAARVALNAADEVAVELFLDRKICYYDIAELVCEVVRSAADENYKDYAQIAEADRAFREKTLELARKLPQPQPICD